MLVVFTAAASTITIGSLAERTQMAAYLAFSWLCIITVDKTNNDISTELGQCSQCRWQYCALSSGGIYDHDRFPSGKDPNGCLLSLLLVAYRICVSCCEPLGVEPLRLAERQANWPFVKIRVHRLIGRWRCPHGRTLFHCRAGTIWKNIVPTFGKERW